MAEYQALYEGFEDAIAAAYEEISGGSGDASTECVFEIGGYRVTRLIGGGGTAGVYHAVSGVVGQPVALKVMTAVPTAAAVHRFLSEAEKLRGLKHENICQIYEGGTEGGRHFIAMEWIDGPTLAELMNDGPLDGAPTAVTRHPVDAAPTDETVGGRTREDPFAINDVVHVLARIARALEALHGKRLVHRDVKPDNIVFDSLGTPKLVDFGFAAARDEISPFSGPDDIVGTLPYMAPEQLEGRVVDPRVDIWAAGVVLYECLTGQWPFFGATPLLIRQAILNKEPPNIRSLNPQVSRDLAACVEMALQKDVSKRYANARVLADDLQRYLAASPVQARLLGPVGRAVRRAARHRWSLLLVASVVAALAFFALWMEGERRDEERRQAAAVKAALSDGLRQMSRYESEAARESFRVVLGQDTAHSVALAGLLLSFLEQGDREGARRCLHSHDGAVEKNRGLLLLSDYINGVDRDEPLPRLADLSPDDAVDPTTCLVLGLLHMQRGHMSAIDVNNTEDCTTLFRKPANSFEELKVTAFVYAEEFLERAYGAQTDNIFFLYEWAHALSHCVDKDGARRCTAAINARWSQDPHGWLRSGLALAPTDPTAAEAAYRKVIETKGRFRDQAYNNLVSVLLKQSRNDGARLVLDNWIRQLPKSGLALARLAVFLNSHGEKDRAAEIARDAMRAEKPDARAWHIRAYWLANDGKLEAAEAVCRECIDRFPHYVHGYGGLTHVLGRRKDKAAMVEAGRLAVEKNPSSPHAMFILAIALREAGRIADSLEAWESLLAIDPDNRKALIQRATTKYLLAPEDLKASMQVAIDLVRRLPKDLGANLWCAGVYGMNDRVDDAVELLVPFLVTHAKNEKLHGGTRGLLRRFAAMAESALPCGEVCGVRAD